MIQQPSQYDCDNMEKGDVIFVRQVSPLYKLIRRLFLKGLNKIMVRDGWDEPITYVEYYQEDCTLLYAYEVACVQKYENQVPCIYSKGINSKAQKTELLPILQVGLYNTQILMNNNDAITFPTSYIQKAIEENQRILKCFDDNRKIQDAIRFQKYKGSYFKQYVKDNHITVWVPIYCSVCGNSVQFTFMDDKIEIHNNCECKSLNFPLTEMTYDEFSLWYANQVVTQSIANRYNSFWFKRGD